MTGDGFVAPTSHHVFSRTTSRCSGEHGFLASSKIEADSELRFPHIFHQGVDGCGSINVGDVWVR